MIFIVVTFGIAVVVLENDIAVAIVTAGTTIFVAIFSAIWARKAETTQAIEQQIREKKTPIYEEFIDIAIGMILHNSNPPVQEEGNVQQRRQQQRTINNTNSDHVARLAKLTPQFIVWSTDEVIGRWVEFRRKAANPNSNPIELLLGLEEFVREIRKDLGHKEHVLKKGDLLRVFVNNMDKHLQ